ncbi:uncharacterized protein C8A04DRAFT_25453, partial [Dichotomopilus funicola]
CEGRYQKQFELITAEVQLLPDVIWELSYFESLYESCLYGGDMVQRVISSPYQTLFKFWYRCTKILESPVSHVFTTNRKLQLLVDDLKSNSASLSRIRDGLEAYLGKGLWEAISAEHVQTAAARHLTKEAFRKIDEKIEEERQKAEIRRSAEAEQQNERTWDSMRRQVQFMEDNELNYDVYQQGIDNRHAGTCKWLFDTIEFQRWITENADKSVFWLSGKHGAGKSFLCSSAIQHINDMNKGKSYGQVFRFLTKDFYITRNQILRHLASQLLLALSDVTPAPKKVPDSIAGFRQIDVNNSYAVENLIRAIISELPMTFIFIDGLDEAEYVDDDRLPAPAQVDDVQAVVQFLIRVTTGSPGNKVKLWLSSQPLPQIREYICQPRWASQVEELSLQTRHTEKDILSYLASAIGTPNANDSFGRIFVTASLASEAEGSFLWVNTMLQDLKYEADDDSELFKLAQEGLPTKMSEVYMKVINRLRKRRKRASDGPPLWSIILSLVTFAKRPLKMGEVIEAIAMTKTDDGHNLRTNRITTPDKILSSCMSLVRQQANPGYGQDSPQNSVLRLSHSAVRAFLIKNSDVEKSNSKDAEQFVTSQIIKNCCLRYPRQPRYRHPLEYANGTFRTHRGESLEDHQLLTYAAKYWYQHFHSHSFSGPFALHRSSSELRGSQDDDMACVKAFLCSSNFRTCLQIQCLFVVRHFMQKFDRITDEATAIGRALPNWIPKLDPQIHPQESDGVLKLEKWTLDGAEPVSLMENFTPVPFTFGDTNLKRYWVPSTESFRSVPLVPNVKCVIPPNALALSLDSNHHWSALRIGSQLLHLKPSESVTPSFVHIEDTSLGGPWEDVITRGPYLVLCRRRVPRPQPPAAEMLRSLRLDGPLRRFLEKSDPEDSSSPNPSSSASSDSLAGTSSSDSSDSDSDNGLLDIPSAEESWDEGSTSSEHGDSSGDSIPSHLPSDYERGDQDDELDLQSLQSDSEGSDTKSFPDEESGSDVESHSGTDSDQSFTSLVSLTHVTGALLESGSESGYDESDVEDDEMFNQVTMLPDELKHELGIYYGRRRVDCAGCGANSLRKWYHCIRCKIEDGFNICHRCERRKRWCLDQSHQLFRMVKGKAVGVITRGDHRIRQEIKIYENGDSGGKVLFHLRKQYTSLLYQSPPVIHPQHPLAVWPLAGRVLLFADFKANNFFEQRVKSSGRRARKICVNLSFSPCGQHLRVASMEAEVRRPVKPKGTQFTRGQTRSGFRICLNLHVMVLRLSSSNPTKSPPKLLYSTSFRIGPCSKPIVQQFPFTFTWCPTELFVTLSDLHLRVYRVTLPTGENPQGSDLPSLSKKETTGNPVSSTPSKRIYLPRSSKNRSVNYFPPRTPGGDSTVVIGPRYGRFLAPPIVVYLSDDDIGGWVPVSNGEGEVGASMCAPRQTLEGQLEHFVAEQDCDIIPFDC